MNKKIDGTYICIQSWMRTDLDLKGVELELFAIIYGYSMADSCSCFASTQYFMDWTGASKPTIYKTLNSLIEKGLIIKNENQIADHLKTVSYSANLQAVKNFNLGGKETLPGAVKNFNLGGKETLPNNKDDIQPIIYNNINKELSSSKDDDCGANTTPINEIVSAWNQLECLGIPPVKSMSPTSKRYRMLKSRIKENGKDNVLSAIESIKDSPFLLGKAGKEPFLLSFDWFVKPNNFIKVYEGNYLDRAANKTEEQEPVDEWRWQ